MKITNSKSNLIISRALNESSRVVSRILERLASGRRLNSPSDDLAAYSTALRLDSKLRGLSQGVQNLNQSMSLLQVADSALSTQIDIVTRMQELAIQAGGVLSENQRQTLQAEMQSLLEEFNRITNETEFNGLKLLNGSLGDLVTSLGSDSRSGITLPGLNTQSAEIFSRDVGSGKFTRISSISGSSEPQTTADFNGDGLVDLIRIDGSTVSVNLSRGDGTFRTSQSFTTDALPLYSHTVKSGDFNGDGFADLIIADSTGTDTSSIYLGRGDGTLSFLQTLGGYNMSVEVADLNKDGLDDIMILDFNSGGINILNGKSTGSLSADNLVSVSSVLFDFFTLDAANSGANLITTGDFNGDGRIDFAFDDANGNLLVQAQASDGSFSELALLSSGLTGSIRSGDMNNDGRDELIYFNGARVVTTSINDSGLATSKNITATESIWKSLGDFNNDGNLDYLSTDEQAIYFGNGNGAFQSQSLGINMQGHLVADFNNDGILDISRMDTVGIFLGRSQNKSALSELRLDSIEHAAITQEVLENALDQLLQYRSEVAQGRSRLELIASSHLQMTEVLQDSLSKLRDVDLAIETAELTRAQILQQAQIASLAQSQISMRSVLALLRPI